jgi:dephospho-CoA kinase
MKIIGLTGGIGSGKTTVLKMFQSMGGIAYIADKAAKNLLENSPEVRAQVIALLGPASYGENRRPKRAQIAKIVFRDPQKLKALNAILHPLVEKDFEAFLRGQNAPYVIYESALLFETRREGRCDVVVLVTAPKKTKISRIVKRDAIAVDAIEARMQHQWTDARKIPKADYRIENKASLAELLEQVSTLHHLFSKT